MIADMKRTSRHVADQEATYAVQQTQSHDHLVRAEGKSWRDAELARLRSLHVDITQN